ncbi:MAG: YDG domain-containing protein, partial [Opitutales bacterium]
ANYSLVQPAGLTADITSRSLALVFTAQSRTYDGTDAVSVSSSDDRLTGDLINVSFGAAFADKNVGTGKTVNVTSIAISGADAANYSLPSATGATSADITRLASVTWVGGASGNWFDPANWAGGAVPDLANVGQVVIPVGVEPVFGLAAVSPAQSGPVDLLSLSGGSLDFQGGVLNVAGNSSLVRFTQSGGVANFATDLILDRLVQTGGQLIVGRDLTAASGFDQTASGTVTVARDATLSAASAMSIGNLAVAGQLSASVVSGVITLVPGTSLSGGGVTLTPDPRNQGQSLFLVLTEVPVVPADVLLAPLAPGVTVEPSVTAPSDSIVVVASAPVPVPEAGVFAFGQALAINSGSLGTNEIRAVTVEAPEGFVVGRDSILAVAAGDLKIETVQDTGALRITGAGSQEDYEKVLRSLALRRSGGGPATIRLNLTDSSGAVRSVELRIGGRGSVASGPN